MLRLAARHSQIRRLKMYLRLCRCTTTMALQKWRSGPRGVRWLPRSSIVASPRSEGRCLMSHALSSTPTRPHPRCCRSACGAS
eukprot:2327608-Prymnesium_polylepis.1